MVFCSRNPISITYLMLLSHCCLKKNKKNNKKKLLPSSHVVLGRIIISLVLATVLIDILQLKGHRTLLMLIPICGPQKCPRVLLSHILRRCHVICDVHWFNDWQDTNSDHLSWLLNVKAVKVLSFKLFFFPTADN